MVFSLNCLRRSPRDARFSFFCARSMWWSQFFFSGGLGRERKVVGSFPFGVSPRLNQRKRKKKSDDSPAARAMGESCETRPPFVQINRFPHRARRGVLGSASLQARIFCGLSSGTGETRGRSATRNQSFRLIGDLNFKSQISNFKSHNGQRAMVAGRIGGPLRGSRPRQKCLSLARPLRAGHHLRRRPSVGP